MDVVSGESSGGSGQTLLLYPLLFGEFCRVLFLQNCVSDKNEVWCQQRAERAAARRCCFTRCFSIKYFSSVP